MLGATAGVLDALGDRMIGELARPLLSPAPDEHDGYVPNVLYSCGAVRHGPHLVIPYGIGDASIGFATADIDGVLGEMVDIR